MSKSRISELKSVSPEPVQPEDISKLGPINSSIGIKIYEKSLPILLTIQKYSTLPFSLFYGMHLSGVVIGPALTNIEFSHELMSLGRSIYQAPIFENFMIWGSIGAHVISGILIRGLRMYHNSQVYGKAKANKPKHVPSPSSSASASADQKIEDKDYGLGGIFSIFGLGTRKSITSRWFGLSPLSFSGYIFLILTLGHAFNQRIIPILIDGDSSYIDLSFISHALAVKGLQVYIFLPLLTMVSSYHVLSGWNRYLKRFTLQNRKTTYISIATLTCLSIISLLRISTLGPAVGSLANKFNSYFDFDVSSISLLSSDSH